MPTDGCIGGGNGEIFRKNKVRHLPEEMRSRAGAIREALIARTIGSAYNSPLPSNSTTGSEQHGRVLFHDLLTGLAPNPVNTTPMEPGDYS